MAFHSVFLIVEPPAGPELHFSRHTFALEVADHGAQHFVVARVQAVQDGFWQQVFFVLLAQQFGEFFRNRTIVDRIEAHIRPQQFELTQVVITQCANMVLLDPTTTGIFRTKEHQHGRFKLRHFMLAQRFTGQTTRQDVVEFRFIRFSKQHHIQRMVRHFTAVCSEVIQAFGQRGLQIGEATDIGVGHLTQLRHVVVKGCLLNIEGFVRAPARQHFDGKGAVLGDRGVMFQ